MFIYVFISDYYLYSYYPRKRESNLRLKHIVDDRLPSAQFRFLAFLCRGNVLSLPPPLFFLFSRIIECRGGSIKSLGWPQTLITYLRKLSLGKQPNVFRRKGEREGSKKESRRRRHNVGLFSSGQPASQPTKPPPILPFPSFSIRSLRTSNRTRKKKLKCFSHGSTYDRFPAAPRTDGKVTRRSIQFIYSRPLRSPSSFSARLCSTDGQVDRLATFVRSFQP